MNQIDYINFDTLVSANYPNLGDEVCSVFLTTGRDYLSVNQWIIEMSLIGERNVYTADGTVDIGNYAFSGQMPSFDFNLENFNILPGINTSLGSLNPLNNFDSISSSVSSYITNITSGAGNWLQNIAAGAIGSLIGNSIPNMGSLIPSLPSIGGFFSETDESLKLSNTYTLVSTKSSKPLPRPKASKQDASVTFNLTGKLNNRPEDKLISKVREEQVKQISSRNLARKSKPGKDIKLVSIKSDLEARLSRHLANVYTVDFKTWASDKLLTILAKDPNINIDVSKLYKERLLPAYSVHLNKLGKYFSSEEIETLKELGYEISLIDNLRFFYKRPIKEWLKFIDIYGIDKILKHHPSLVDCCFKGYFYSPGDEKYLASFINAVEPDWPCREIGGVRAVDVNAIESMSTGALKLLSKLPEYEYVIDYT